MGVGAYFSERASCARHGVAGFILVVSVVACAAPEPQSDTGEEALAEPDTVIDVAPDEVVDDALAVFEFSSTEDLASFECRVDAMEFVECSSPFEVTVDEGEHLFEVRAVVAGLADSSPAGLGWRLDTTPPSTRISVGPEWFFKARSTVLRFSADESNVSFECRLDTRPFERCESPLFLDGLANGPHKFYVRAVDAMGHREPESKEWSFYVAAPALSYDFESGTQNLGFLGADYDAVDDGVSYTEGEFGKAATFDHTVGASLTIPGTASALSQSSSYTISLWFRETQVVPNSNLLDFRNSAGGGGVNTYHGPAEYGSTLFTCYSNGVDDTCGWFDYAATSSVGEYQHLLIRYDEATGANLEIFHNGTLVHTINNASGASIFSGGQATDLVLGVGSSFEIDNFEIYDQAFSETVQCIGVLGGEYGESGCALP